MAIDKRRARQGRSSERIPEGLIFFIASAFGSIGVYLGMVCLRHKTRTWYFVLGIPFLILQQGLILYWVYTNL